MRESSASPFLHRADHVRYVAVSRQAENDRAQARLTLEKLRYRWWVRRGTLAQWMQFIGDKGREYCGFLHPRQTGGGWW